MQSTNIAYVPTVEEIAEYDWACAEDEVRELTRQETLELILEIRGDDDRENAPAPRRRAQERYPEWSVDHTPYADRESAWTASRHLGDYSLCVHGYYSPCCSDSPCNRFWYGDPQDDPGLPEVPESERWEWL